MNFLSKNKVSILLITSFSFFIWFNLKQSTNPFEHNNEIKIISNESYVDSKNLDLTNVIIPGDVKPTTLSKIISTFQSSPYIIHFWATWCAPCLTEFPMLMDFLISSKGTEYKTILVLINDDNDKALTYYNKLINNKQYANTKVKEKIVWVQDYQDNVYKYLGISKLPESIISSSSQSIRRIPGAVNWDTFPK